MKKALWILAALLVLYVGAYASLVKATPYVGGLTDKPSSNIGLRHHGTFFGVSSDYRVGGEVSKIVFAPINEVDRWLRPEHWEYPGDRTHYSEPAKPLRPPGQLFSPDFK